MTRPINWEKLGRAALQKIDPRDRVLTRRGYQAMRRGAKGRAGDLSAAEFLSVCHALGLDPLTQAPPDPADYPSETFPKGMPAFAGELIWPLVAMGAMGKRMRDGLTMEEAGRQIGISAASLSRLCHGDVMSAAIFLKACAWLAKHPNEMTVPPGAFDREADPFSRAEAIAELEKAAPIAGRIGGPSRGEGERRSTGREASLPEPRTPEARSRGPEGGTPDREARRQADTP